MPYLASRVVASLLCLCLATPVMAAGGTDVRILIDISGSMRQNDPNNLRRPALRMMVGLMQPGTEAGVWTFAKWVNMLVKHGPVDTAWKQRAQSLSEQIKSPGQFTNIEEVLRRATADWETADPAKGRHLVLLTDGMVDVSREDVANTASRQRILDEVLPAIKAAGAQVHTIALSVRADHDLMKRLAGASGGWYEQVDSADQLQRVFLKIFEQAAKPDALPLKDNRFTVDASVQEATILLFRKTDSPAAVLISPDGRKFTESDVPAGVAWFQDQGYDLITLSTPAKGEWSLQADLDPDNRVMIVTDLKLVTSDLPAHLAVGESVRMTAHLSNHGKQVRRKAFLNVLDVRADAITASGRDPLLLNDRGESGDQRPADGMYTLNYSEKRAFDDVEVLLNIESATFMREKRYHLSVREPVDIRFAEDGSLSIEPDTAVLREGATILAWQGGRDDRQSPVTLSDAAKGALSGTPAAADEAVFVEVSGESRTGNPVKRLYGPVYRDGLEVAAAVEPVVPETPAAPTLADTPEPEVQASDEVAAEEEEGWLMPALMFGGVNVLLILSGLGFWWFMRRRGGGDDDLQILDDDASPDAAAGASGAAAEGDGAKEDAAKGKAA